MVTLPERFFTHLLPKLLKLHLFVSVEHTSAGVTDAPSKWMGGGRAEGGGGEGGEGGGGGGGEGEAGAGAGEGEGGGGGG